MKERKRERDKKKKISFMFQICSKRKNERLSNFLLVTLTQKNKLKNGQLKKLKT